MDLIYEGIRTTPARIARTAMEEGVDLRGLSVLSGSHLELVAAVRSALAGQGLGDLPVVVGRIIPPADAAVLREQGVAAVYTPGDSDLNRIVADVLRFVAAAASDPTIAIGPALGRTGS